MAITEDDCFVDTERLKNITARLRTAEDGEWAYRELSCGIRIIYAPRAARRWLKGKMTGNHEDVIYGRAYFIGLVPGIIAGMRKKPA